MKYQRILTTNEEAEYIRKNHFCLYFNVDITPEGEYINRMTGPHDTLKTIRRVLNTEGPNKFERS